MDIINSLKSLIVDYVEKNNLKLILHFPHSSLAVPDSFWKDVDINKDYYNQINIKMSDVLLLELFNDWHYDKVIAPYSRLYVDVEKYWDDSKEIMFKYGMGAIYTKDMYGQKLHNKKGEFVKEAKEYYDNYHHDLSKICNINQDVLLLDIHSFNKEMANIVVMSENYPDLCIGINHDDSCDNDLCEKLKLWCNMNNISYRINYPYEGTILPNKRSNKNKIYSIMFEFNKTLYL